MDFLLSSNYQKREGQNSIQMEEMNTIIIQEADGCWCQMTLEPLITPQEIIHSTVDIGLHIPSHERYRHRNRNTLKLAPQLKTSSRHYHGSCMRLNSTSSQPKFNMARETERLGNNHFT